MFFKVRFRQRHDRSKILKCICKYKRSLSKTNIWKVNKFVWYLIQFGNANLALSLFCRAYWPFTPKTHPRRLTTQCISKPLANSWAPSTRGRIAGRFLCGIWIFSLIPGEWGGEWTTDWMARLSEVMKIDLRSDWKFPEGFSDRIFLVKSDRSCFWLFGR